MNPRHLSGATLVAALVTLVTSTAAIPASSASATGLGRVERSSYSAPGGVASPYGFYLVGTGIGGVEFQGGPERAVSIRIEDETGLPVAAEVQQFSDSDETFDSGAVSYHICGSSGRPLRIRPDRTVYVFIYAGPCDDGTPALATRGEVTARFAASARPRK